MAKQMEHKVAYYYDSHPTLEDLMPEASLHAKLIRYLMDVLTWLLREQTCAIHQNLGFYRTPNSREYPVAPDIAVILGVPYRDVRSWHIGTTGPAPQLVIEIASEQTWDKDLSEKPKKYSAMGVQEYVAYDPNEPLIKLKKGGTCQLVGWQRDPVTGEMHEMALEADGRLWSPLLKSFFLPERGTLLLTDHAGHLHLTQAQAEAQRAQAADTQAQAEAQRAQTEAQRAKILADKLRSLGIDPDQL